MVHLIHPIGNTLGFSLSRPETLQLRDFDNQSFQILINDHLVGVYQLSQVRYG
jgi:hypothetical protein